MIKRTTMPEPFDVTQIPEEESIPQTDVAAGYRPSDLRKEGRHDYISDLRSLASGSSQANEAIREVQGNEGESIPEDAINPSHYRKHPSGIECIEVTRHMNFNVGNAIKYLWRYMDKGDPIENLKKAQWYISDEIVRLGGLHK